MSSIDNRVVEMQFDNKQFEEGVKTSMSTLDKLKEKLKLKDAESGLDNVNQATLSIKDSISNLENRFSAFGIVEKRVIENITDSIMRLSNKISGVLTQGIIQGGKNRAMNLENAHFQLQGLLKDEEEVSAVMQNVNDSVDGTAYSLDAAAKVASQFAATGMRAGDEMYSSLRAVAGVAAMTNSEYDSIGQIFTTVAGNGRLMGEQLLQLSSRGLNAASTVADYLTKIGNGAKVTEAEVRDMVSKGKISFETFAAAMDDAFGEHAKKANETFTGAISNIKAALARIGALFISPLVEQNGAFVQLFNAIRLRINDIKTAVTPVAEAFCNAVNSMAKSLAGFIENLDLTKTFETFSERINLTKITNNVKELIAKFKMSTTTVDNLRRTLKGVFAVFDIGVSAVKAIVKGFANLISVSAPVGSGLLSITASIGDYIVKVAEAIRSSGIFTTVIEGIGKIISSLINKLKKLVGFVSDIFSSFSDADVSFVDVISEKLKSFFDILLKIGKNAKKLIAPIGKALKNIFSTIADAVSNVIKNIDLNSVLGIVNRGLLASILFSIKSFVSDIINKTSEGGILGLFKSLKEMFLGDVSKFLKPITSVLDGVKQSLGKWQESLQADKLMSIAKAVAILASSLVLLSGIDGTKLIESLASVGAIMIGLVAAMSKLSKTFNVNQTTETTKGIKAFFKGITGSLTTALKNYKILTSLGTLITKFAVSMLILASAVKVLSTIYTDDITPAIVGVVSLLFVMGELIGASVILAKTIGKSAINPRSITAIGKAMIEIAAAIYILSFAVKKIADLDIKGWGKGIGGIAILAGLVTGLALALASFTKSVSNAEKFSSGLLKGGSLSSSKKSSGSAMLAMATSILVIAAAMRVLTGAVIKLGETDPDALIQGGIAAGAIAVAIGLLIAGLGLLTKSVSNSEKFSSGLFKGSRLSSSKKSSGSAMLAMATSILIIAAAMRVLTGAVIELGETDTDALIQGGIAAGAIAVAIGLLLFGLHKISSSEVSNLSTGAVSFMMSVSIWIVAKAMKNVAEAIISLSTIKPEALTMGTKVAAGIAAGVVAMMAALNTCIGSSGLKSGASMLLLAAGIYVVAQAMNVLVPAIKELGQIEWTQLGLGIGAIALSLAALLGAATWAQYVIPGLLALAGTLVILGAGLTLIGFGASMAATGFSDMSSAVSNSVSQATNGVVETLLSILNGASEIIVGLISAVCTAIVGSASEIINAVCSLIDKLISALAEYIPKWAPELAKIFVSLFDTLKEYAPQMLKSFIEFCQTCIDIISEYFSGADIMAVFTNIAEGIGTVIGKIFSSIFEERIRGFTDNLPELADCIVNFANRIGEIDSESVEKLSSLANAIDILSKVKAKAKDLPELGESLAKFLNKFDKKLNKNIDFDVMEKAAKVGQMLADMASTIPKKGKSDLKGFTTNMVKFGEGIQAFYDALEKDEDGASVIDLSVVETAVNAATMLIGMANEIPNDGGILGLFAGNNDLGKFSKNIEAFGEGIQAFYDALGKTDEGASVIDLSVVETAVNAATMLIGMANGIPNDGGILGLFAGNNDLGKFSKNIEAFGEGIMAFYNAIDPIDNGAYQENGHMRGGNTYGEVLDTAARINLDNVNTAVEAGKALVTLAQIISEAKIKGKSNFEKFSTNVPIIGEGIKGFSEKVVGIDESAITAASQVAPNLASAIGILNGIKVKNKDYTNFKNACTSLGEAVANFATGIKDIANSDLSTPILYANSLVNLDKNASDGTNLKTFGSNIKTFGEDIAEFATKLDSLTLDYSKVSEIVDEMTALTDAGADAGTDIVSQIISGIKSKSSTNDLSSAFSGIVEQFSSAMVSDANMSSVAESSASMIDKAANAASEKSSAFEAVGNDCASKLVSSLVSSGNLFRVYNAGLTLGKKAVSGAKAGVQSDSPSKAFIAIGNYCIDGLVKGLSNSKPAEKSAAQLGTNILTSIQKKLKINSPSLVFKEEVGRWIAEGITEGIESDMTAEEAAEQKAENIAEAFSNALDSLELKVTLSENLQSLWELTEGKNASISELAVKQMQSLTEQLGYETDALKYYEDQYTQIAEELGESSDEAIEYQSKLVEQQIKVLELQQSISETEEQSYEDQEDAKANEHEQNLTLIDDAQSIWELENQNAKTAETYEQQMRTLNAKVSQQNEKTYQAWLKYKRIADTYGSSSEDAKDALHDYNEELKTYLEYTNDIPNAIDEWKSALTELSTSILESSSSIEDVLSKVYDIREAVHSSGWSDEEKAQFETEKNEELANAANDTANRSIAAVLAALEDNEGVWSKDIIELAETALDDIEEAIEKNNTLLENAIEDNPKLTQSEWADQFFSYHNALSGKKYNNDNQYTKVYESFIQAGYSAAEAADALAAYMGFDNTASSYEEYEKNWTEKYSDKRSTALLAQAENFIPNIIEYYQSAIADEEAERTDGSKALENYLKSLNNACLGYPAEGEEIGESFTEGLAEGIASKDSLEALGDAAEKVCDVVTDSIEESWDINSPSLAAKNIGENFTAGLALGISDGIDSVILVIQTLAQRALTVAKSGLEFTPSLRPVSDRWTRYAIDSTSDGGHLNIDGSKAIANGLHTSKAMQQFSDERLLHAISSMDDHVVNGFEMLKNSGEETRVVLDSGALVGQLVGPLDRALGRRAAYSNRGMY